MDSMDPEQMLEAMKDFEFDAEAMEEQIDRFMEMFQQAMESRRWMNWQKDLSKCLKTRVKLCKI